MNRKVLGGLFLGLFLAKVAGRRNAMAAGIGPRSGFGPQGRPGFSGFGPEGRRGFRPRGGQGFGLEGADPRRQWARNFHRSLHEADEKATDSATSTGTDGDAAPTANPATAG